MNLSRKIKALLLAQLGTKKSKAVNHDHIQTILILRYDRLGDMIVTTPLFAAIKKILPACQLSVLASKGNHGLISANKLVDVIYTYPANFLGKCLTLINLRRRHFDLVIDLNHSIIWHTLIELRVISPRATISPKKGERYGVSASSLNVYDWQSPGSVSKPLADVYLELVRYLGASNTERYLSLPYDIPLKPQNAEYADGTVGLVCANNYGLNFFGGRAEMCLAYEHWATLLNLMLSVPEHPRIFVFGAPKENMALEKMRRNCVNPERVTIVPRTHDVLDACAIIKRLSLLLTPDTALVHVASTYNIPIVAVYADEKDLITQWSPRMDAPYRIVRSKATKSLAGYDINELIASLNDLLCEIRENKLCLK